MISGLNLCQIKYAEICSVAIICDKEADKSCKLQFAKSCKVEAPCWPLEKVLVYGSSALVSFTGFQFMALACNSKDSKGFYESGYPQWLHVYMPKNQS